MSASIDNIVCPECGASFPLSEALREDLDREVKAKSEKQIAKLHKEHTAELKAAAEAAEKRARKKVKTELEATQQQAAEAEEARAEAQEKELELMKVNRQLKKTADEAKLEIERQVAKQRESIEQDVRAAVGEQFELKQAESQKTIERLKNQIGDMQRTAGQGSMETQGEVLEDAIKARLTAAFPVDLVEDVPKGVRGADLVHEVRDLGGIQAGKILWECKNAKNWSAAWTQKLKDDVSATRAQTAVIVSSVLPEGVEISGQVDGVWVTTPAFAVALANLLREGLIAVKKANVANEGKDVKMEMVYQYLSGGEFNQHLQTIAESFGDLQEQILKERRAMESQWKAREKLVERALMGTARMYGDLQGIVGGQLPALATLELEGDGVPALSDGSIDG